MQAATARCSTTSSACWRRARLRWGFEIHIPNRAPPNPALRCTRRTHRPKLHPQPPNSHTPTTIFIHPPSPPNPSSLPTLTPTPQGAPRARAQRGGEAEAGHDVQQAGRGAVREEVIWRGARRAMPSARGRGAGDGRLRAPAGMLRVRHGVSACVAPASSLLRGRGRAGRPVAGRGGDQGAGGARVDDSDAARSGGGFHAPTMP